MHPIARAIFTAGLTLAAYGQSTAPNPGGSGTLTAPVSPQRHWADAREYELGRRATEQPDPDERIRALLQWEAAYPTSEFERERAVALVGAYQAASRTVEAFARAVQAFQLHPKELAESILVAELAPRLALPSPSQVEVVKTAARNILDLAPETARQQSAQAAAIGARDISATNDPEAQRVVAMIRAWRRGKPTRTTAEIEREIRQVAEAALDWAKGNSK
ncbi:hypothetical protein [uncultured Paludibaculum sp.]|uniref:hypothetical protein n=1 Tax=uncultured Paludibaculum sp. TaxID=1765020 RepID=UPI002AAA8753|nr:hypothetical protein [uncultured Paludibaculum sp.]